MEQPKLSSLTSQPSARLKSGRLIANSIAGAVIGLLVWVPLLVSIVGSTCCIWIGIALLHLVLLVIIGAIAGAIGTATIVNRTLFFWRGSLSSFVTSLLVVALLFIMSLPPLEADHSFLDSAASRLIAALIITLGGTLAGTITALNFSSRKTQVLRFFDALLVSITGPLVGGGLAAFIGAFLVGVTPGPQSSYAAEPLLVQIQYAFGLALFVSILSGVIYGPFGSVYAFIGGIAGQAGDSALVRAIGAAFGTVLGLFAIIGFIAFLALD